MTRLDAERDVVHESPATCDGPRALLLESREVPLGGVRGMHVSRALPQRDLPMVGAWCFLDRFGPQTTRMRVEPHPHIGLQTVTWPFVGRVHHRDTLHSDVVIQPGELNIMTSGAGIAHSEYSPGDDPIPLDALQLWVALPESRRHGAADFERHRDLPTLSLSDRSEATVVLGVLGGVTSPATVHTPIVGAHVNLSAGDRVRIPLRGDWEYAVLCVEGSPRVDAAPAAADDIAVPRNGLLYLGIGRAEVEIAATDDAVLFVLGGEPFGDEIVMWWNFVARGHDEIVTARDAWEAHSDRYGVVPGHGDVRVPAPPLPGVRLTPRRRRM